LRRPGPAFQPIFSSPPESPAFGRFGGRGWVRGGCRFSSLAFRDCLNLSRHETRFGRVGTVLLPQPVPLPQHRKRVGGEGANGGIGDPGHPQRLLPWGCPGLPSDARPGLYREEAASCHFANVQSKDDDPRRDEILNSRPEHGSHVPKVESCDLSYPGLSSRSEVFRAAGFLPAALGLSCRLELLNNSG